MKKKSLEELLFGHWQDSSDRNLWPGMDGNHGFQGTVPEQPGSENGLRAAFEALGDDARLRQPGYMRRMGGTVGTGWGERTPVQNIADRQRANYMQLAQNDDIGELIRQPQQSQQPVQNNGDEERDPIADLIEAYPVEKTDRSYQLEDNDREEYNFMPFNMSPEVQDAIIKASKANEVDRRSLETMAQIESSGGKNMNSGGSYTGLMQLGKAEAKVLGVTDRSDIYQSADGGAKYWLNNARQLQKILGRKPENWEVYLAHQQGASGASQILTRPDELMTVIRNNNAYFNNIPDNMRKQPVMTGREFANYIAEKWNGYYYQSKSRLPKGEEAPIPLFKPYR